LAGQEIETDTEEREMIASGQTVENRATGDRLTFCETARGIVGEYIRFEALIAPGGQLPSEHLHPNQSERFEFLSGSLTMKSGGRKVQCAAAPSPARSGSGFRNRPVRLAAPADTRLLHGHGDPLLRASRYASTPPVGDRKREVRPCHP